MYIAIMDYNSNSIFITEIPEDDTDKLLESEDFDINLVLGYINKKYDKHFKMTECNWMYSEDEITIKQL